MRRAGWELPNGGQGKPAVLGPGQGGEQLIGEGDTNVWALPSNESGRDDDSFFFNFPVYNILIW
jgi:hypothetical protein